MAQTLANGVVIPDPGDRISARGVAEMRTLGASVNTGLALTQAQTAQTDLQSRARDADLADQIAGMEGMTYVGAWESGRTYRINDVVTHGGDSWARLTAGDAGEPGASPEHWGLVARKGDGGGFGELSETDVTGLYETVEPEPSVPVSWADLTGKPDTYPSTIPEVDGLQDALPRIDSTAGTRVFVQDVMIHGSTGWRDLTPYLAVGVTPSTSIPDARFRRIGDIVEFTMKVDLADDFADSAICTFPAGFTAPGYRYLPGAYTAPTKGAGASAMEPISMIGYVQAGTLQTPFSKRLPAGSTLIWAGRFDTNDPWPVTLPGDPA